MAAVLPLCGEDGHGQQSRSPALLAALAVVLRRGSGATPSHAQGVMMAADRWSLVEGVGVHPRTTSNNDKKDNAGRSGA